MARFPQACSRLNILAATALLGGGLCLRLLAALGSGSGHTLYVRHWDADTVPAAKAAGMDWYWSMADPLLPFDWRTRRIDPSARGCSNERIHIDVGAHKQAWTPGAAKRLANDRNSVEPQQVGPPGSPFGLESGEPFTIPADPAHMVSVFAFEPQLQFFYSLKQQGLQTCVFPINAAVALPGGPTGFTVSRNGHSSSLLSSDSTGLGQLEKFHPDSATAKAEDWRGELEAAEVTTVMTVPLSELIPRLPSGRIEYVKIDAQGYDLQVAKSAKEWLRVIDKVVIEAPAKGAATLYTGGGSREDTIKYMENMGFELVADVCSFCGDNRGGGGVQGDQPIVTGDKIESNLYFVNKDTLSHIGEKCPGVGCEVEK